jgi:hypothetical protein
MTSFSDLHADIIYEIAKYISIRDTCILSATSKLSNQRLKSLQSSLIIYNFKIHNKNYKNIDIGNCYDCIQNNLINHIYKYKLPPDYKNYYSDYFKQHLLNNNLYYRFGNCRFEYLYNQWQNQSHIEQDNFQDNLQDNLQNNTNHYESLETNTTSAFTIDRNWYVNLVFSKVFYWFVYNNYSNIKKYPNKFELYALYNFLQIEVYQNKMGFHYLFNFLESIADTRYYNVRLKYYSSILDTLHTNQFTVTFDQMFTISNIIISIPIFKKLFGIKVLNLSRSKLHLCCLDCNEEILRQICKFKLSYQKDELVSYNYVEFKKLLKMENPYYFAYLENTENYHLNEMIYVKNPSTNKRMRINGNLYKSFINYISLDNIYYYNKMIRNIAKRREYLRIKIFT